MEGGQGSRLKKEITTTTPHRRQEKNEVPINTFQKALSSEPEAEELHF